jgi:hypothetical protein
MDTPSAVPPSATVSRSSLNEARQMFDLIAPMIAMRLPPDKWQIAKTFVDKLFASKRIVLTVDDQTFAVNIIDT